MKKRIKVIAAATILSLGLMLPGRGLWAAGAEQMPVDELPLLVEEAASETVPETEAITETEIAMETETEAVSETEAGTETETEAASETETEIETETETEAASETEIETEIETEAAVIGAENDAGADGEADAEADADADADAEAEADADADAVNPADAPAEKTAPTAQTDKSFSETIKETMMNREASVTVTYPVEEAVSDEEAMRIATQLLRDVYNRNRPQGDTDNILNHTGVPDEGDYLKWHALASYSTDRGYVNYDGSPVISVKQVETEDGGTALEIVYNFQYLTDSEMETEVSDAAAALISELGLDVSEDSDYQKAFIIYDYICRNVVYGSSSGLVSHAAYAAFMYNEAVCQGYATMFYRLALAAGIDNRIISGKLGTEDHGWNLVRIGDSYYYADTTLDAGNYAYQYFLLGAERFGAETGATNHVTNAIYMSAAFEKLYPVGTDYVFSPEEEHTHLYGWISDGDETHHSICYLCGLEGEETEAHTFGEAEYVVYEDIEETAGDSDAGETALIAAGGRQIERVYAVYTCTKCGALHEELVEEDVIDDEGIDDDVIDDEVIDDEEAEEEITNDVEPEEEQIVIPPVPDNVPPSPPPGVQEEDDEEPVLLDQKSPRTLPVSENPAPVDTSDPAQPGPLMFLMISMLFIMAACLPLMRKNRK